MHGVMFGAAPFLLLSSLFPPPPLPPAHTHHHHTYTPPSPNAAHLDSELGGLCEGRGAVGARLLERLHELVLFRVKAHVRGSRYALREHDLAIHHLVGVQRTSETSRCVSKFSVVA